MMPTCLRRERVYDPVLRLIHAWNALLVVLLIITAITADQLEFDWVASALRRAHLWLGYLLLMGLVARVVWGWVGPEQARWKAMWHPGAWLRSLRERRWWVEAHDFGHHPLASGVYLAVYAVLAVAVISGLALAAIDQARGPLYPWLGYHMAYKPWAMTAHAWLDVFFLGFTLVHIGALILHEKRDGVPMAQSMISGYQYRKEHE